MDGRERVDGDHADPRRRHVRVQVRRDRRRGAGGARERHVADWKQPSAGPQPEFARRSRARRGCRHLARRPQAGADHPPHGRRHVEGGRLHQATPRRHPGASHRAGAPRRVAQRQGFGGDRHRHLRRRGARHRGPLGRGVLRRHGEGGGGGGDAREAPEGCLQGEHGVQHRGRDLGVH